MKRAGWVIIISVNIALLLFSCKGNGKKDERETFEFYYYPNKNVYYDVEKKKFFYSLDGAKTWNSFIDISDREPSALGEKVVINSPDSVIFRDNENHRRLYAGKLYRINNSDVNVAANVPEVSERKIISKPKSATPGDDAEVDSTVKKGIRKLFDKIFGKHHKK